MPTYLESSDEDELLFEIEEEASSSQKVEEFVNNVEALGEKLKEFGWDTSISFRRHQTITSATPVVVENAEDDLERELAFYNQAVSAAKQAIENFEKEGTPWKRPEDYYAEMVKSDGHMSRIKDQLMFEQKRNQLAEQRRKARESKKFAKQVQAAKRQEKESAKKKKTKDIQTMRKERKRRGFGEEFDWDMAIEEADDQTSSKSKHPKRSQPSTAVKSGKRMYKDARYGRSGGFGPARTRKKNTTDSAGDMGGYSKATTSTKASGIHKKGKKQRLGKNRRISVRSKQRSRN